MTRALLIGKEPAAELGYDYVMEAPYDAVVIGSLTLSQLLRFRKEGRSISTHRGCRKRRKTGCSREVWPPPSGS